MDGDMRVLIVEGEAPVAESIEAEVRSILGSSLRSIHTASRLDDASSYVAGNVIDLCLLDPNLGGEDGFDLLKKVLSCPFLTVVISARTDRALEAFEYGVVDFIPRPFSRERLRGTLEKILCGIRRPGSPRFVISRKRNRNFLVRVDQIVFLKAVRYLVEAHLIDGKIELLEKPLSALEFILPDHFFRIHRSWTANMDYAVSFGHAGGNVYVIRMKDGTVLPLSRSRYPFLCRKFHK